MTSQASAKQPTSDKAKRRKMLVRAEGAELPRIQLTDRDLDILRAVYGQQDLCRCKSTSIDARREKARRLLGRPARRRRGNFCFPVHQDGPLAVTFRRFHE